MPKHTAPLCRFFGFRPADYARPLLLGQVGRRDVFRLHRVERSQPRPGYLVVGYPLRDSALGKPGNSHHLGPAAHDLDDIGSVHG